MNGYMPSLLVVSAALAQATSRIELGTGVVLAPLYHPLRLAEDAATVQLLSHGRLVLGLGLGWSEVEFAGLGADARRRGTAMDEILRILPQAWSGEPSPTMALSRSPDARRPAPAVNADSRARRRQRGGRRFAAPRALRRWDVANAPAERLVEQVRWVLDECARTATRASGSSPRLLPGASRANALARYRDALWGMQWKYSDMGASATRRLPPPSPPPSIAG